MTIQELLGDRRDEILRLASRHGAYDVRVIGSVARGEASPQSDLDLLVRWSDSASMLDHAALMLELEGLLGKKVDIASDGWLKPAVRESVYRDAIPL